MSVLNRTSKRELIRRQKGVVRKELLSIPEWPDEDGQPIVVEVRSLTGGERADYMNVMQGGGTDENGRIQRVDFRAAIGELAYLSTFDPDDGERIFESPQDALEYDAGITQKINAVAQELSGLNATEEETAGNV